MFIVLTRRSTDTKFLIDMSGMIVEPVNPENVSEGSNLLRFPAKSHYERIEVKESIDAIKGLLEQTHG